MTSDPLNPSFIKTVKLSDITLNPHQPRKIFSQQELEELSQSIVSVGLIHPPLVRCMGNDQYELVSGERRLQASRLAGLKEIPVHIMTIDATHSAQMALIENIQRVDLNPLEIAKALKELIDNFQLSQEELATKVGKKRSSVANYLRLLTLPSTIKDSLLQNSITMGHAKAILSLEGESKQFLLHELILRDDLNVREAESAALRIHDKVKRQKVAYRDQDFILQQLADKAQQVLGTKVFIEGHGKRGRIMIHYYNLDDLDRLLDLLNVHI